MKRVILIGIISSIGLILNSQGFAYDFSYDINFKNIDLINIPSPQMKVITKNSSQTQDPYLYLPIFKKVRYEYTYESTNFLGKRKITVEFLGYSQESKQASARIIYHNKNKVKVIDYLLKITEKGIVATYSIGGGERIEIPIPLFKDKRWTEGDKENRVIGFSSKVETPYGKFDNLLKILTTIKGAEIGKRERYYAANIGLVKEVIRFEDKTDIISLERFEEIKE